MIRREMRKGLAEKRWGRDGEGRRNSRRNKGKTEKGREAFMIRREKRKG